MAVMETFSGYGTPPPDGEWNYEIDDNGIVYGPGLWPFYRAETGEPAGVRLAPDTEYRAWGSRYVLMFRRDARRSAAYAHGSLCLGRQGMGTRELDVVFDIDLRAGTATLRREVPAELAEQATAMGERIVRCVKAARREHRAGTPAPTTAHERYNARQAER